MATATPTQTPNPNALKFVLDVKLAEMINVNDPVEATTPFTRAVLAVPGVMGLFGVNDFVTITRRPDGDWSTIIKGVTKAIETHL
jgi:hypothetical protein